MTTHKCLKCKEEFELEPGSVRCPFCGFRIVCKTRPKFKKRVLAR